MKAINLSLSSLFFTMPVFTQNYTNKIAEYMHMSLIDSIVNSHISYQIGLIIEFQLVIS